MHAIAFPSLMRLLVLASALALAACASVPGPDARADAQSPEITLVTLNLWHATADWPKRPRLLVGTLRDLPTAENVMQDEFQYTGLPNRADTGRVGQT